VECPVCDGEGYETCDDCSGEGTQESWSKYEIEQQNYVSINKSLLNYLEVLNELEPIDESKYGSYVIMIYSSSGNTSDDDFQDVMGETVFAEVNTSIELEKRYLSNSINDPELTHWV
jgi:antirestriction protein